MLACRIRTDGFIDPCIPTLAAKPPVGSDWVHEIEHDGYWLIVRPDGATVLPDPWYRAHHPGRVSALAPLGKSSNPAFPQFGFERCCLFKDLIRSAIERSGNILDRGSH
jgi:hypothetical protein